MLETVALHSDGTRDVDEEYHERLPDAYLWRYLLCEACLSEIDAFQGPDSGPRESLYPPARVHQMLDYARRENNVICTVEMRWC